MTGLYESWLKRPIDFFAASIGALAVLPVMALCAIAIRLDGPGSVIFRQRRVGSGGCEFTIYKFRSMRENVGDVPSDRAAGLPVTRVGRWLRRSSLDELPQLWNVVRGDMSLVGPRPALPSQLELIRDRSESRASLMRPGITGLAQVCSYDGMTTRQKSELDAQYASRVTFLGDASIVMRTFAYLLRRPPVY